MATVVGVQPPPPGCCILLLCFFLPPLAVALRNVSLGKPGCSCAVLLNLLLCLLAWVPGVLHAYFLLFTAEPQAAILTSAQPAAGAGATATRAPETA